MYLYVVPEGLNDHTVQVNRELRLIEDLRENIRLMNKQPDVSPDALFLLRKCETEASALAQSFRWRTQFLQEFPEDVRRINEKVAGHIHNLDTVINRSID